MQMSSLRTTKATVGKCLVEEDFCSVRLSVLNYCRWCYSRLFETCDNFVFALNKISSSRAKLVGHLYPPPNSRYFEHQVVSSSASATSHRGASKLKAEARTTQGRLFLPPWPLPSLHLSLRGGGLISSSSTLLLL